ncbi:hypothetical protein RYX36_015806 [Vicia faba]
MNMETIAGAVTDHMSCNFLSRPCFGKKIKCPTQCPLKSPSDPNAKVCSLDCASPVCSFKFYDLSSKVEGVLGRTYPPDFENPVAKLGVAMPVVGGENRYRTTSLLSADCGACLFVPGDNSENKDNVIVQVLPIAGML